MNGIREKLEQAKSLQVIESPREIAKFLAERAEQAEARGTDYLRTLKDGTLGVSKQVVTTFDPAAVPSADKLGEMAASRGIEFQEGDEERVLPIFASDERVDRDGDILEQTWKFQNFERSPIILFGHAWSQPPIGNSLREVVTMREDADYNGPALHSLFFFARPDVSEFGDSIFRLMRAGVLRTVSVGFFPGRVVRVDDKDEREELGLGPWGVIFQESELLEISAVSVPANPGALVVLNSAKQKGLLEPKDFVALAENERCRLFDSADERAWQKSHQTLSGFWRKLFPDVEIAKHDSLDTPVESDEVQTGKTVCTGTSCGTGKGQDIREWKGVKTSELWEKGGEIGKDEVVKPFPNEHSCRVRDPEDFEGDSFRRLNEETEDGKRLDLIIGRLRGADDTTLQAFRYPKDEWEEADARSHCTDHDGILFEPATEDLEDADAAQILHCARNTERMVQELLDRQDQLQAQLDEIQDAVGKPHEPEEDPDEDKTAAPEDSDWLSPLLGSG